MRPVLLRRLGGSCAVLAAASVAVGSVAHPGAPATVAADQRPALTDDDGGEALFDVPALMPGQRIERCIRVKREDGLGPVRLAADPHGPLADQLSLAVARGDGGGFGDCDGFNGTVVFRGSLADAATGLDDADWKDDGAGRATYRLVLKAPADLGADAGRARVAFRWTAEAADTAQDTGSTDTSGGSNPTEVASTPAPGPTTGASATPSPSSAVLAEKGASPKRRSVKRPDQPAHEGDRPEPGRDAGAATPPTGNRPARPKNDPGGFGETLQKVAAAVARAAVEGAKRAAFPILLLVAMGLFMLFQNRMDSRDPKLALAPVHGSPDLAFDDPYADRGR